MSAAYLRETARLMRQRATSATDGPWSSGLTGVYQPEGSYVAKWEDESQTPVTPDRLHIASWHPLVALAVADWLDATADRIGGKTWTGSRNALAVARAWRGDA